MGIGREFERSGGDERKGDLEGFGGFYRFGLQLLVLRRRRRGWGRRGAWPASAARIKLIKKKIKCKVNVRGRY